MNKETSIADNNPVVSHLQARQREVALVEVFFLNWACRYLIRALQDG